MAYHVVKHCILLRQISGNWLIWIFTIHGKLENTAVRRRSYICKMARGWQNTPWSLEVSTLAFGGAALPTLDLGCTPWVDCPIFPSYLVCCLCSSVLAHNFPVLSPDSLAAATHSDLSCIRISVEAEELSVCFDLSPFL